MANLCTGQGRFSYAFLTKPAEGMNGGAAKFRSKFLIPKEDTRTKEAIDNAIAEAIERGKKDKWNGKAPKKFRNFPIQDGDGVREFDGEPFGEECHGHWVLSCSANEEHKPVGYKQVGNKAVPVEPSEVYSGMYGKVLISFYPYSASGNNGIACSLNGYLKTRDGDAFSESAPATAADFGLEADADFEDLSDL